MATALTLGGVVVLLGNAALVTVSWRKRSVLAGVLGLIGIPLVAFALVSGMTRHRSELALLVAAVALLLGSALFALGQALDRLLEAEPEDRT